MEKIGKLQARLLLNLKLAPSESDYVLRVMFQEQQRVRQRAWTRCINTGSVAYFKRSDT